MILDPFGIILNYTAAYKQRKYDLEDRMIEIRNVIKNFGSRQVLKGISFRVEDGQIAGLLGSNGAGKSTTMNILAG